MTDKRIITEQELNYIETLYLYCDLESFAEDKEHHPTFAYFNMKKYLESTLLVTAKHIGIAEGREWYQLSNYRIGIMDYDKAKIVNQHNCTIQYEQHHMFTLDKDLNGLDLPFEGSLSDYHIKRIDITKIAKLKEDYTTNYGYMSPYRGMRKEYGTVYLGHRKNGNVFRMYDKTKELLVNTKEKPINYKKISLLSEYFGDIEDLYTFELELHRKYLKGSLGIETLADLSKVYAANHNIVSQIRFYKDNDRNRRLIKNDHQDRVSCRVLTDFEEYERVQKKRYAPSFNYLINKMKKEALRYVDSMELERNNDNLMPIINALTSELIDHDNKDMVITFEDTHLSHEMDEMSTKHKLMRDNQSNDLELQAKWAFQRVV